MTFLVLSTTPLPMAWGNSPQDLVTALIWLVVLSAAFWVIHRYGIRVLRAIAKRTSIRYDDVLIEFLDRIPGWVTSLFALTIAIRYLHLPLMVAQIATATALIIVVVISVLLIQRLLEQILLNSMPTLRGSADALPAVLRASLMFVLWTLGLLLVLSNMGINVLSLVAGLGIGGIAVALAVQNILGDMFSSFSLYLDQPFREGDFIVTGSHMGVVKKIGLKSTRIQALQGEEIVISNQELTSTRIQNFKRMKQRRVVLHFGVTYDTSPKKMHAIPEMVRGIVEKQENVRFDRAHFATFGDYSLNFEVVYYILSDDYNVYMNIQQAINLALLEACAAESIEFAFPTRVVHVVSPEGKNQ